MRIMVELTWTGGILAEGEPDHFPEPEYEIVDADSGRTLVGEVLATYEAVEACIAREFPDVPRWRPEPATPEESQKMERLLAIIENPERVVQLDTRPLRLALIANVYQYNHPEALHARLVAALARLRR